MSNNKKSYSDHEFLEIAKEWMIVSYHYGSTFVKEAMFVIRSNWETTLVSNEHGWDLDNVEKKKYWYKQWFNIPWGITNIKIIKDVETLSMGDIVAISDESQDQADRYAEDMTSIQDSNSAYYIWKVWHLHIVCPYASAFEKFNSGKNNLHLPNYQFVSRAKWNDAKEEANVSIDLTEEQLARVKELLGL